MFQNPQYITVLDHSDSGFNAQPKGFWQNFFMSVNPDLIRRLYKSMTFKSVIFNQV